MNNEQHNKSEFAVTFYLFAKPRRCALIKQRQIRNAK